MPGFGQWERRNVVALFLRRKSMPKLTEAQIIILSKAAQREDGAVLPLSKSIKLNKGAAAIVLKSLLKHKLVSEKPAGRAEEAWREAKDGGRFTLSITKAGLEAIGIDPNEADQASKADPLSKKERARSGGAIVPSGTTEVEAPKDIRAGTKQALLIDLLKRKSGATIAEAVEATGWQKHSIRGAISGALKKKLGLTVTSEAIEGRGRVYHISNR
jgi:Protein of unknown function (DUF3489)